MVLTTHPHLSAEVMKGQGYTSTHSLGLRGLLWEHLYLYPYLNAGHLNPISLTRRQPHSLPTQAVEAVKISGGIGFDSPFSNSKFLDQGQDAHECASERK